MLIQIEVLGKLRASCNCCAWFAVATTIPAIRAAVKAHEQHCRSLHRAEQMTFRFPAPLKLVA